MSDDSFENSSGTLYEAIVDLFNQKRQKFSRLDITINEISFQDITYAGISSIGVPDIPCLTLSDDKDTVFTVAFAKINYFDITAVKKNRTGY